MKDNVTIESFAVILDRDVDNKLKAGDVVIIEPQHGPILGRYVLDGKKLYKWDGQQKIQYFRGCAVSFERELVPEF